MLFAEGLGEELKQDGVDVLALSPAFIRSEFMELTSFGKFMSLPVDRVVRVALKNLGKKRVVTPGFIHKLIEFVKEWNKKHDFRGCPFLNITMETTDIGTNIRKEVIYNKDGFRSILRELVKDLKNFDDKYSNLDVSFITDSYHVILEGAIVACQSYGDAWPFEKARKNIEKILMQHDLNLFK